MTKLIYTEDVSDWMEEAERDENFIMSEEDIITALRQGYSTAKVGRCAFVSRLLGYAPEEIMRPNKLLLNVGLQAEVIGVAHSRKRKVKVENGAEYNIPELVGYIPEKAESDGDEPKEQEVYTGPSYVDTTDKRALEWATLYLEQNVPGHIWSRLLIIYENGGDVRNEADKLKQVIDEMVAKIV